ncbi:MAG: acetolactate synthase small subunit [Fimbriimonadaceae bacterium]|nr:acetolactate synthase small subunit [Fimbriimonadaceae bacterium]
MSSLNGSGPRTRSHTISVEVENRPGVLTRVAGLFARRGYNIESLAVSTTERPDTSRMTIVVDADDAVLSQICRQVGKLIDVKAVNDNTDVAVVARELALLKVACGSADRPELIQFCDVFRARIVDLAEGEMIIEVTGNRPKIDAFIKLLDKFAIIEMARTGEILLARGLQDT